MNVNLQGSFQMERTLESVKKDLNEFQDTVNQEANQVREAVKQQAEQFQQFLSTPEVDEPADADPEQKPRLQKQDSASSVLIQLKCSCCRCSRALASAG